MEKIKTLEDELKVMTSIVKGRCKNLENIKVIEDIQGFTRADLLKIVGYCISPHNISLSGCHRRVQQKKPLVGAYLFIVSYLYQ